MQGGRSKKGGFDLVMYFAVHATVEYRDIIGENMIDSFLLLFDIWPATTPRFRDCFARQKCQ